MNDTREEFDLQIEDLLYSNSSEVMELKVKCLIDRSYYVPDWFYKYIDTELILNLMLYECNYAKNGFVNNKFIAFMLDLSNHKTQDIDVKIIINSLTQYHMFEYCVLLDLKKVYKYIKSIINELTVDMIKRVILCCIRYRGDVTYKFVNLYLTIVLGRAWYIRRSKPSIKQALSDLYFYIERKSVNDRSITFAPDIIYRIIYEEFNYWFRCGYYGIYDKLSSEYYWEHGGTYISQRATPEELGCYLSSKRKTAFQFDSGVVTSILKRWDSYLIKGRSFIGKRYNIFSEDVEGCKHLILQSAIHDNGNNVSCIYWELNDLETSLVMDIISGKSTPIIPFNSFDNLCSLMVSNPVIKTNLSNITNPIAKDVILGYIRRGGDPYSFFTNIYESDRIPEDIASVIVVYSSIEQIMSLSDNGFKVILTGISYHNTERGFDCMDFPDYVVYTILHDGHLFGNDKYMSLIFDKLFDNIPENEKEVVIRTMNIQYLLQKYPKLSLNFNIMLSLDDKRLLIDSSPKILPYLIQSYSIPYEWSILSIQRFGFMEFKGGITEYIPIIDLFEMVKNGHGVGYILDIVVPTLRNAFIKDLLYKV